MIFALVQGGYTLAATDEKYAMEYMMVSERPLETYTEGYERRRYCMEVDLNTENLFN